ncbi:MerR family transcriptional regulator [Calothrix sp. FACHB-156]|nr:MerR family transcriptional regulator [Calothrix sp. FACHB-156]
MPEKYGNSKKPTVIYSWEQVLEIRAINDLRQKISLQTVRNIVKFLDESGFDISLKDKHLVVVDDQVFWVMPDWSDMPRVMKVADKKSKGLGQFVLIILPPISDIIKGIWETAKKSKIVDFESFKRRAKAEPFNTA